MARCRDCRHRSSRWRQLLSRDREAAIRRADADAARQRHVDEQVVVRCCGGGASVVHRRCFYFCTGAPPPLPAGRGCAQRAGAAPRPLLPRAAGHSHRAARGYVQDAREGDPEIRVVEKPPARVPARHSVLNTHAGGGGSAQQRGVACLGEGVVGAAQNALQLLRAAGEGGGRGGSVLGWGQRLSVCSGRLHACTVTTPSSETSISTGQRPLPPAGR